MNLFFDSIIILYLIAALTFAVAIFCDRKVPNKWEYKHPRITLAVFIFLCSSALVVFWGSFIEPRIITINRVSIDLPNFEPTQPVRVALISDVHVGTYKKDGWVRRVSNRIITEHPDLVLMAGDMIVDKPEHAQYLSGFRLLTTDYPVYAVLGDHDYHVRKNPRFSIEESTAQVVNDTLTSAGMHVLRNEAREINIGCTGLSPGRERTKPCNFWLVGLDDWLAGKTDFATAVSVTKPPINGNLVTTPFIILVHNPDFILDPQSKNADLILSGNTHGGQIRIPLLGPAPRLPSELPRSFDEGLFNLQYTEALPPENRRQGLLFITSGISESGPRARLFNPPEIVLLELR
ncbi:hypothetical protein A3B21_02430 [Candidatus Uhrbacteria bacterium RIFCSPLOWO2_01_FULL_47_24]|uniref:Calcineurin-like phosphoesterase domain-containing protein n=1 Tax=Candidatus Uhrbacteria bacterium RIFCSPLOWO2_01_FULL_47_24 TaxID=1802401 RepID=A0A1F7UPK1_9BACT|nr:MAG: hypothetical protein A2753_04035 [Candidatus Uhrbacteria bacterium RIFCSPHIGHO2_01_FULL_47_11]OGL68110.1 MAG: hypothetical protein A3D58_00910 [Candidatus Uhrbacteria bacterium RIFCSPHIGHO2_02_FULL_46_47]OGL75768.1 MAG: hypothetical protein A3F52_03360 [Candidatus Uhrbacteria bacterium RIFCSPHIGHO2_12_FULL_47_11]OGL80202.1 MAG: hypothetical protein A3B21_02430 [Candidatus Uhrbacteria bacterium RIFCSPLOWO2_01_FULL_47_24]OGL84988.1 MAG: hypothetical protein A3J03_04815 [Candidatus Uhrbact